MTGVNGAKRDLGAYRTPDKPPSRDFIEPLEPFSRKCPSCKRRHDLTMGFPRGRDKHVVSMMQGKFSPAMVMIGTKEPEKFPSYIDCTEPDPRPHLVRGCQSCHTMRVTEEAPKMESIHAPGQILMYLVVLLLGVSIGLFVRMVIQVHLGTW